ncbi:prolyl aminopeptidase [Amphritea sp. 2_MG-2023]|jgi:proline iminopeptidase|uniref:prolyl aminopeptidase n=1 Tax=Amphritea TaxID=515417 RepID=UPI001C0786B3|nr:MULTISPECIES: prolyl aminopeptidase [Amphritea]MBU2965131.1 prolyl aminopeptidase [Amphritea atlantica]MDO6418916.1 prolyl aminopeptidase [Amphritea sp. 2_MG-2023]
MNILFPDIKPYKQHQLAVDDLHTLYIEESGNAQGIPVLFIHGGPGGGTSGTHRKFFDPEKYRIILFDQRGCGQSTPHAELTGNTTQNLISDIEQIRQHLNIDQWLLFGGSWGSTLSLLYAESYPERVSGMILRGIFLCRERDIRWFYQEGASAIFPDYWQEYQKVIPPQERGEMLQAYYKRLTSDNDIARMSAAKAWAIWEGRCSTLNPNNDVVDHFGAPHIALAMARIEAHYFINNAFIDTNQIIRDAHKIQHIPTVIVHGRYDMVCPIEQAFALQQALPQAELHIVRDAGHSAFEPGNTDNLIKATKQFSLSKA